MKAQDVRSRHVEFGRHDVGFYAAFRRPTDTIRFEHARVLLTLVSFVINVVTI